MSNLRKIMQKLAEDQSVLHEDVVGARPGMTELLRQHLEAYQQRLEACSSAMLQYEWAWLEEHISSLELCLSQPEMLATAGGKSHVEHLIRESQLCQELLHDVMNNQGVEPARHPHAVVIGEHAWEVSQESIRRLWGMG
jgi:hypothetical protein